MGTQFALTTHSERFSKHIFVYLEEREIFFFSGDVVNFLLLTVRGNQFTIQSTTVQKLPRPQILPYTVHPLWLFLLPNFSSRLQTGHYHKCKLSFANFKRLAFAFSSLDAF